MADNFFDEQDIVQDDFFDSEDVFEEQPEAIQEAQEPEEMGVGEAALTGFGQGASFGLSPIISGIIGAGTEAVEDVADVAGLTTDSDLRDQGFEVEDDYKGLDGLMQAYYDMRDRQKAQEEKAFEDQTIATIAGNIPGSIASTIATGGLAGAGKAGQVASKILPKAENLKDAALATKIGVGAREGMKAGALSGFGQGEGKLLEDPSEVLEETASTAAGGGALGGLLPVLGAGAKKSMDFVKGSPLAKNIGLGYKAGKEGIDIADDDQVVDYISGVTKDIRNSIAENFKGSSKKELLEQADEIGIRLQAGEAIDDIINDIKETGAFGAKSQKELSQFVDDLRNLSIDENVAREKVAERIERGAAKKINQQMEKGGKLVGNENFEKEIGDVLNKPDIDGELLGTKNKMEFLGKDGKPYTKDLLNQSDFVENQVPLKKYDLDNLKVSEADEILRKIGERAYGTQDDAAVPYAKELYGKLRELSNDAMQSSSLPEKNKKLKALFDGLESLGIKPKDFFSKQEVIRDQVEKKIQQKLTASPLSAGDSDMKNFLKYLSRADDALSEDISQKSKFASDLSKFVRQSEGEGSVSLKAAAGPVQKILAKGGNVAGAGVKSTQEFAKDASRKIYNKMIDMTPDDAVKFGEELASEFGDKATPYINQLVKAAGSPEQRRNALMYGIYQQPAFRKMLERVGRSMIDEGDDQE